MQSRPHNPRLTWPRKRDHGTQPTNNEQVDKRGGVGLIITLGFLKWIDPVGTIPIMVLGALLGLAAYHPCRNFVEIQQRQFDDVLRKALLINISVRTTTIIWASLAAVIMVVFYVSTGHSIIGGMIGLGLAAISPRVILGSLKRRRLSKLEDQLVPGVQSLASGVRAGLNLTQAMELIARDSPKPIRQEFIHLLREYEYGVPLDEAMSASAGRIGSGDYRLLFAALITHRQRGGDLGETLDRISGSIREIQRLQKRVETLTAQGRATARWLGAMPLVIGGIIYLVDETAIISMFQDSRGIALVIAVILLNIIGFLWIRKIMAIDI